jgi:alpha-galactosidase
MNWWKRPAGLAAGLLLAASAATGAEKLQVFILSGQSNMVGHASSYLLANLLDSPRAEDAGLAKLVIADYERTLRTVKPKMDALQQEIDALAGPAGQPRKAARKSKQDDQSPAAQAKSKAHEQVRARVDALAKKKGELLKSVRYNEGKKVRIAAFGEVDRGKRATGIVGPIAPGYGSSATNIGPEYGFGMALESKLDSPVLLIKVSWGGIDIDSGFRPPSSKKVGDEAAPPPSPGPKYQELVKQVHAVLADLKTYHPAYDPKAGYEMAGFYWFQGFNDKFGDKPTRYKEHMANFIRDIRAEFKTPGMPFVIGVIGTGAAAKKTDYSTLSHAAAVELGKKETADQPVAVAQREAAALPEFAGTVVAVESYPYYDYAVLPLYEVWKDRPSEWQNAGSGRPYHYLGSARFFIRFGYACGEAMADLRKNP